jgi:tetratricopeptide (TPR) repeat protein
MVREALYELITHKTQKTIHHDVANLLLAHAGGDTNPLEIAQHLEKCGRDAEAADLFERAGNECITRSEWTEAAQALGRAVAALERAQAVGMIRRQDNSQRTLAIKLKLSQALNQSSQWEEAQKVALEVHDLALQFGEPVLSARAARQLGRAISETGKLSEADSILDEAYRTALQCGDLDLAADLASDLGEVRERAGDLRGAMTILVGALDMLEAAVKRSKVTQMAASAARVAEVLNRLGRVSLRFKKTKEALSYWQAALRQATAGQDHVLAARIQGNIGNAQAILGDKGNAMRTLKQALQASQSLGDRLGVAKLLYNLARLYVETGNGEQAAAFARESFDLSVEIGWREGEAIGASMLEQLTGGGGY